LNGVGDLEGKLGYRFIDPGLLEIALVHRSADRRKNNERLEFLGDSVLNLVISSEIFHRRPLAREGELSRLRANLVRKETLAEIAHELDLGRHLVLGGGELKSGGHRRSSILSDALEAVFGAIYLDGGYTSARSEILRLFSQRLDNLPGHEELKDAKTRLQEILQGRQLPLPIYDVVATQGDAHARSFRVQCRVEALGLSVEGMGTSRRRAEQDAAGKALAAIETSEVPNRDGRG
jgi:ribonuclease-3